MKSIWWRWWSRRESPLFIDIARLAKSIRSCILNTFFHIWSPAKGMSQKSSSVACWKTHCAYPIIDATDTLFCLLYLVGVGAIWLVHVMLMFQFVERYDKKWYRYADRNLSYQFWQVPRSALPSYYNFRFFCQSVGVCHRRRVNAPIELLRRRYSLQFAWHHGSDRYQSHRWTRPSSWPSMQYCRQGIVGRAKDCDCPMWRDLHLRFLYVCWWH